MNIKTLLTLLLSIAGTSLSFAQSISGKLLDENGKPMPYGSVVLFKTQDSTMVKGTLTNENGLFQFDHISPGNYRVKATLVGYKNLVTKPVIVAASAPVVLPDMTVSPQAHALNTVTVSAAKPLIVHKIDRMVMNVENSILAAGNSAMDILERAPGVTIDKDDNISMKGKQGVTVMINGKLTYLTTSQLATLLRSTDGTTIQSIELITNPSAKYDAAGGAGIINIILKKNKQGGTNVSLTAGTGYGAHFRDDQNITFNHKEGELNIFGSFSHSDNPFQQTIAIKRIIPDTVAGPSTYFRQATLLNETDHDNSYRIGADYDLSPKNTVGFVFSGYFNNSPNTIDGDTYIGSNFTRVDSSLRTASTIYQTFRNIAFNLNDTYRLDTLGQEISADLDASQFKNNNFEQYVTSFYLPDGSSQHPDSFLGNMTPSTITIRTEKADYVKPIRKSMKLEAGVKFSNVKTDNDLTQATVATAPYLSVNHFIYDEKIDAGYLNFNGEFKNYSIKAGLRAEYTRSTADGDSAGVVSIIKRHYLDLFPSLMINHTFDDRNQIGFSYGRRIDRPQYDNLNPFVFHLDPYTYQSGNPYLKPQYTSSFELSYTYNKSLSLTLGYSKKTDLISQVPGTDPVTKSSFITVDNIQNENIYNLNMFTPYVITRWWEGDVNVTAFYQDFRSNGLDGGDLSSGGFNYNIQANETFTFFDGYKAELSGSYQSPMVYALFNFRPRYSADAGLSHSFDHKKLNVKLSISDIFNTSVSNVTSNYENTNLAITQKRETRITRLTLTYNFGNNKLKGHEHQSGANEEKSRVKGGN